MKWFIETLNVVYQIYHSIFAINSINFKTTHPHLRACTHEHMLLYMLCILLKWFCAVVPSS